MATRRRSRGMIAAMVTLAVAACGTGSEKPASAPPAPTTTPPAPTAVGSDLGAAGGAGEGTITTGQAGTLGDGDGGDDGDDGSALRERSAASPVRIGIPRVKGALDRAVLRRYLARNVAKLTACYETARAARPGLEGDLTATFTIGARGRVISSTASGLDPTMAACVARVIQAIEFPAPGDAGQVDVEYPLLFRVVGA